VDWNLAHVGNPLLDIVGWLPSLKLEGGPDPWELVPDSQGFAALLAGYFASRAGLPPPATAPHVREFQRRQAEIALPWAARELGLPPP
jgi:aminoglycoside phosphotransferase (APT) family kinase protein